MNAVSIGTSAQSTVVPSVAIGCSHSHRPYAWWERRLWKATVTVQRCLSARRCPNA